MTALLFGIMTLVFVGPPLRRCREPSGRFVHPGRP